MIVLVTVRLTGVRAIGLTVALRALLGVLVTVALVGVVVLGVLRTLGAEDILAECVEGLRI